MPNFFYWIKRGMFRLIKILAIETSCDETSIAIADFFGTKRTPHVRILSHIVLSQISLHKKFGGVVPNLARREHEKNLAPILLQALKESNFLVSSIKHQVLRNEKSKAPNTKYLILNTILGREPELLEQFLKKILPTDAPPIDVIAVTYGPGLAPALWVGVNFARALSYLWEKPLIPVNHMAGHLYSALLQNPRRHSERSEESNRSFGFRPQDDKIKYGVATIKFPALALLVSGGHTELVLMKAHGKFKVIGETLDDAAGEAFDKVARILGFGYPGGPEISRQAEKSKSDFYGPEVGLQRIKLPRPMIHTKDHNFSFSGLKTAVLYLARDLGPKKTKRLRAFIAKEFQDAVVEVLVKKTIRAAKEYKVKTILLGGGVAANKHLRQELTKTVSSQSSNVKCRLSDVTLAGDNALMIAAAAYFMDKKIAWRKLQADANLRLD